MLNPLYYMNRHFANAAFASRNGSGIRFASERGTGRQPERRAALSFRHSDAVRCRAEKDVLRREDARAKPGMFPFYPKGGTRRARYSPGAMPFSARKTRLKLEMLWKPEYMAISVSVMSCSARRPVAFSRRIMFSHLL